MGVIIAKGDGKFVACTAGETTMGTYLMIVLTLLLFGAIAYYVLSVNAPEKAPVTGFEVTGLNSSTIGVTSLAGSSLPVSKVFFVVGDQRVGLTGLDDRNGNGLWDAGETALVRPFDITKPTRFAITSGSYLLLDTYVKYAGTAAANASVPPYSPGLTATYYRDEAWTTAGASKTVPEIRFADDAGSAVGYPSDEVHWPVPEVGQDDTFSVKFDGLIKIDAGADYTFYLTSDDGSFLYIDGTLVVDNGGLHSPAMKTGTVNLTAGYHNITARMFEHTGQAVIGLEYSSPAMARTLVTALYHIPGAAPNADFTAIPTVANAPVTVQFHDASADASAWSWDFGDGGTSTSQNPAHTYATDGDYTVKLTAINGLGSDTAVKSRFIQLGSALAGFTATYYRDETWSAPYRVKSVSQIRFADNAGAGAGYASDEAGWPVPEIGQDETFSVKFEGALKIDAEADYTFYLTSDDGSYLSIDGTQVIDNGGLHSATEKTGTVHLAAGYHAIEVKMFEHTGEAVIRLEYSSPAMPRTFVGAYHAPVAPPVAFFTGTPLLAAAPATVQFHATSLDASAWSWDFGDGGTSTSQNPAHNYTASGNYTVSLTVSNSLGNNTVTVPAYVRIGPLAAGFRATYYADEGWTSAAGSETVAEIKLADPDGVSVGYASDRANWPAYILGKTDIFSVGFAGSLKIDAEADYTFYLTSDDGSYLSIDGAQVIDNGGLHSATEKSGTVHLTAGYHGLEVKMYEHTGQAVVRLEYSSPAMPRKFVQETYTA